MENHIYVAVIATITFALGVLSSAFLKLESKDMQQYIDGYADGFRDGYIHDSKYGGKL